jgi:hypothetical protein
VGGLEMTHVRSPDDFVVKKALKPQAEKSVKFFMNSAESSLFDA